MIYPILAAPAGLEVKITIQYPVLIMLSELFFLGVLILVLHQISSRLGLNPLIFLLGSLAAMLQFRSLGFISILFAGEIIKISVGSYVILPALLMGLLVIYIVNGSTQARNTLLG